MRSCDAAVRTHRGGKSSGRPPPTRQIEHRVEVGVDEVRHLDAVELGEPVGEPLEGIRRPESAEPADLLTHRGASMTHVEHGSVGEPRPIHRIDWLAAHVRRHVTSRGSEHVVQQTRHRQHGRPVVQSEAVALDRGPPARPGGCLAPARSRRAHRRPGRRPPKGRPDRRRRRRRARIRQRGRRRTRPGR